MPFNTPANISIWPYRFSRIGRDCHLDRSIDYTHRMNGERLCRRRAEHSAITHIERRPVQRTNDSRAAQPPFTHARVSMRADVIQGEDSVARPAKHDFPLAQRTSLHRAFAQLLQ